MIARYSSELVDGRRLAAYEDVELVPFYSEALAEFHSSTFDRPGVRMSFEELSQF